MNEPITKEQLADAGIECLSLIFVKYRLCGTESKNQNYLKKNLNSIDVL